MTERLRQVSLTGLGTPLMVLVMLAMMTLPLPTFVLDMLFTFSITLSLVVLLVSVYILKPLDFAAFPSVLLVATLLRLGLNIASTRVVLLHGHQGGDAAGKVIEAFGQVVIGGNYAVGLIVFAILIIINFVVVTKGAGRISEVTARFTLDAMPGKQMAIDADLNAGLINQDDARSRREEVAAEADFYGAMDGASKFVRGDAVAGILILFINLFGGLIIGMSQHDLDLGTATEFYALLTIGDGLVAQVPALLLSVAAALMVTRQGGSQDVASQMVGQIFNNPRVMYVTGGVLTAMGLIPGMPHVAFLSLAGASLGAGYMIDKREKQAQLALAVAAQQQAALPASAEPEIKELSWDDVQPVDIIGLEVGYRLIPLVDKAQDGKLMGRIKGVRKKLSQELGFLVPSVHIRDNLDLSPTSYRISLMGVSVGEASIYPEREMAINPGQVFGEMPGMTARDPAFGLPAVWIEPSQRDHAQTLGYTVVDASTVVATHLSQILQTHAAELLGHEEVEQLLKMLSKSAPKLVENLVPGTLPIGVVVKILQNLLQEQIPIRDLRTIAETLAEYGARSQNPVALTAAVRIALSRMIVQNINGLEPELPVVTLDRQLEQILQQSIQVGGEEGASIEPGLADRLLQSINRVAQRQEAAGQPTVLLTSPALRPTLARFVRYGVPGVHVLSYQEIPDTKQIKIVGTVGQ
ncbi:MAG: flagellar biosynthesis protein FlhA [Gammaproteobacteria bacterium]|nr:flagellar biosynthesis protein FlhA [Gammaproteobacteria bacterium]